MEGVPLCGQNLLLAPNEYLLMAPNENLLMAPNEFGDPKA